MNEPYAIGTATAWNAIAQDAVTAIRAVDTATPIYVETYAYSVAQTWPKSYYGGAIKISDPSNNTHYSAHQYYDQNGSGIYRGSAYNYLSHFYPMMGVDRISPFVHWLSTYGYTGASIGKSGIPVNNTQFYPLFKNVLYYTQQNNLAFIYCNYAYNGAVAPLSIAPWTSQGAAVAAILFEFTAPSIVSHTGTNPIMLMGTGASSDTVSVYDGATLLGTTTSASDGTWSFNTGTLSSGSHSFTATNSDGLGHVTEPSSPLTAVI